MTRRHYINNAPVTALSAGINAAVTTCVVNTATGFPSATPWTATLEAGTATAEQVLVTGVAGTTLTITRGYDGSAAVSHSLGAVFAHTGVQADLDEANSHVNATTGVHGLVGAVVGTTDTQTLSGKTLTSPTITSPTITGTITSTSLALSGTLGVVGTSTLGAVTASTVAASGALSAPSAAISGNETVGGTLGVTGTSTLAAVNATSYQTSGVAGGLVPAGAITMFGATVAPAGWQLCDGSAISRSGGNAALFAAIGTSYGAGNGSTTFNVPSLIGNKFPRGGAPGGSGGAASVSHSHPLSGANASAAVTIESSSVFVDRTSGVISFTGTNKNTFAGGQSADGTSHTTGAALYGVTDSTSVNHLPPYVDVYFIIKL